MVFVGVVGDIPPVPLELKSRRRKKLLDRPLAVDAFCQWGIVNILQQFEDGPTLRAFVFV
jgi:hypothetical protein